MTVPREVIRILRGRSSVLVTSHVPPDGDGLGAGLALVRSLRAGGARAVFAAGGPIQPCLEFLPEEGEVDRSPEGPEGPFDLAVVLDAATLERAGAVAARVSETGLVLNIDHHVTNNGFGDVSWVDGESPAVGEMVFRLLREAGGELTADLALPLYAAIVTDTGRFGYSNTTPATHETAAALLAAGVRPEEVTDRIYRWVDPAFLRLTGAALASLEVEAEGLLAHVTATPAMIADSGASPLDAGDLVELPISIAGVEVGALFREALGGGTKVSLRSRRWFPVHTFAARFGGGGHARAAGASLPLDLDPAREEVLTALREEIPRLREEETS